MTDIVELQKDIIFIRRDWTNSNSLLIKGKENILVDAGYMSSIPETLSLLQKCGVGPENISLVINTHFHSDHVGANSIIQELSGATIAASELEANFVNLGDRWFNWLEFFGQQAPGYHVNRVLVDGQLLRLGNYEFRVINTPGHSPGGLSLYCEELEMLLSGDALWDRDFGPVNLVVHGQGAIAQAGESLRRLAALNVSVCIPGHGPVIHDHSDNVNYCMGKMEKLLDDPQAVAMHIITRVLTFHIMIEGGIPQSQMSNYLREKGWLQKFNELYFHVELEELMERVLARLVSNGAIMIQAGVITARH